MNRYLTLAVLALVIFAVAAEAERRHDMEKLSSWPPWGPVPAGQGPAPAPKPPHVCTMPAGTFDPVLPTKMHAEELD